MLKVHKVHSNETCNHWVKVASKKLLETHRSMKDQVRTTQYTMEMDHLT